MFKFNLVCSPEMSVGKDGDITSRPHAWVQFDADEEKAFVPLNFILRYPPDWRRKDCWDTSYLYKVFWSPNDEDSPSEMSKRVVQIPVYEKGTSLEKPGYYRASVLAVDESLAAVEKQVSEKRLSVGLLKYKYSSFDCPGNSKSKAGKPLPKDAKGAKKKAKKPQSKGFNLETHVKNLDFESNLEDRYSFLKKGSESSGGHVTASTSALGGTRRSGRISGKQKKRDSSSDTDVDIPDPSDDSKKIKLDPSYTPSKTANLEDELKLVRANLEKSYNRNKKLETDRDALQEELNKKVAEFDQEKARLQEEIKVLQQKVCMQTDEMNELQEQLESLQKKHQEGSGSYCKCKGERFFQTASDMEGGGNAMEFCETSLDCLSDATDERNAKMGLNDGIVDKSKENPERSTGEGQVKLLQRDMTGKVQETYKSDTMSESIENNDKRKSSESNLQEENQGFQLCSGVTIPHDVWNAIEALSKSEKKDKVYIKDLCCAAFGPEVLASSTICGTKKGGRSRRLKEGKEEEQNVKPGLNKLILKAVREKFISRVEESENRKIDLPDEEARTKLKKFYDAIRDGQKRLVGLGYGRGQLSNQVTKSVLMVNG